MPKKRSELLDELAQESPAEEMEESVDASPANVEPTVEPANVEPPEPASPEPSQPGTVRLVRHDDHEIVVSETNWATNRNMWEAAGYRQA